MKLPESLQPKRLLAKASKDRRGVALVTVLTVMALTTILVLTFFSLATSEHRASNVYSNGLQAQQVAEQAVNMVIAQIREATVIDAGDRIQAWSSQPGAVRVWDEDGNPRDAYKLYSDDKMKTRDWSEFRRDFDDAEGWSTRPDHYVDLNEPVIRGEKVYYPIVHPIASTEPQWPKPLGNDSAGIEGFSFNEGDLTLRDEGTLGKKAANVSGASGHLAMPVKWLYQLADGTLGVLNESPSGGGSTGPAYRFEPISGGGTPSAKNPMVARFAFWADDETSKLNINTHAGGLAWDIPKAGGELDMAMGKYQPAQKEWQRYPGHPATTHLIPALAPGVLDIVNDRDAMEMLFKIVPRVVGGGSESGTRIINTRDPKEMNGLVADTDPLFPSVDDMIMRPDREPHEFPDAQGKAIPAEDLSEHLERVKFFVTANSRAPETNLFNKPRIAMWPIYNASAAETAQYLTPFDRLIQYCASMGESGDNDRPRYEYIFRRQKADSSTFDYEIPRNKELYDYLLRSLDSKVPGYGRSFAAKYGQKNTAQLATMIFDYIRSTNLHDDTVFDQDFADAFQKNNTNKHRTYTNPRDGNNFNRGFGHKGHGQVTPIRINANGAETKGMGRFFTLSSAEVVVASVAQPLEHIPGQFAPLGERYRGVTSYQGRFDQVPSGPQAFTNLPPLPVNGDENTEAEKPNWPSWLQQLEDRIATETDPGRRELLTQEFQAAFDPTHWNWQLAFLVPRYRDEVMKDPTGWKFNRTGLTAMESDMMRLQPGEELVQSVFVFNLFSPSIGWVSINPNMQIEIERLDGMTFEILDNEVAMKGYNGYIGFEDPAGYSNPDGLANTYVWATNWNKPVQESGARAYGGLVPFTWALSSRDVHGERAYPGGSVISQLWNNRNIYPPIGRAVTSQGCLSRLTPIDRGYDKLVEAVQAVSSIREIGGSPDKVAQAYRYDLVTIPFKINQSTGVDFTGGNVEFRIFDGGDFCENSFQDDADDADENTLVQTIELEFPSFGFDVTQVTPAIGVPAHVNEFSDMSRDNTGHLELASLSADPANPYDSIKFSAQRRNGRWNGSVRSDLDDQSFQSQRTERVNVRGRMAEGALHWSGPYIQPGDIVQSVAVPHGDMRVVASRPQIRPNDKIFEEHRNYGKKGMAHSLTNSEGQRLAGFDTTDWEDYLIVTGLGSSRDPAYNGKTPLPFARQKSANVQLYGDFDNGAGLMIDGPYINKPDEGNVHSLRTRFQQEVVDYWESRRDRGEFPYFSNPEYAESGGPSYFSPNRIISGPGMLGSLPTGIATDPATPWQTLLFRPNVVGNGYQTHPGAEDPPDHLIMDLFWMPIVEPYAISEPLSTAGKINMNFEIVPFLHVHRDTALRGVFRSEYMLCVPNQWHRSYKHNYGRGRGYHWRDNPYGGELQGIRLRTAILEDETLVQFTKKKFNEGEDIFKSATEICDIHLIPQEVSERIGAGGRGSIGTYTPDVNMETGAVPDMENGKYWRDHSLVGDNSRERPYTNIHNRLTTKSNTFQVHYRAQVIKQARRDTDSEYAEWRPYVDSVQAEYRGSSMVERYVNPNEKMEDFAENNSGTIDQYYRFRVINPRRFSP